MSTAGWCRIAGGVLVLLAGVAVGMGGWQLLRGGSKVWPDVIADETVVRRTAVGMTVAGALLLIAGLAAAGGAPWGGVAASVVTLVVVVAAFWVNHLLFGDIRPLHSGTNVVVAVVILALLWLGYVGQSR